MDERAFEAEVMHSNDNMDEDNKCPFEIPDSDSSYREHLRMGLPLISRRRRPWLMLSLRVKDCTIGPQLVGLKEKL